MSLNEGMLDSMLNKKKGLVQRFLVPPQLLALSLTPLLPCMHPRILQRETLRDTKPARRQLMNSMTLLLHELTLHRE